MTHTEQIKQFIDQLAAGQNSEAKDSIDNILSAKAFDALEEYKKQIANGIFNDNTTEKDSASQDENDIEQVEEL